MIASRIRPVVTASPGRDELLDELVEKLQIRMHEADRIVELVGDARDELTEALQLLALHELVLGLLQLARALLDARLELSLSFAISSKAFAFSIAIEL